MIAIKKEDPVQLVTITLPLNMLAHIYSALADAVDVGTSPELSEFTESACFVDFEEDGLYTYKYDGDQFALVEDAE